MSSGAGETDANLQDVRYLLEQINKHCENIPVAKREASTLAELCESFRNRLSNGSLILQQSNYDDIKSNLTMVKDQLAVWSGYNYLKGIRKKTHIEAGITGFIGKLESIISQCPAIQPATVSSPSNCGVSSDRGSIGGIARREGTSEDITSAVTGTGHNKLRFLEPLPQREETPLVKRLDGEVTSIGDIAFAGGMYCEVWVGRWEKGGREGIGEEKVDVEKVALKALRTLKSPERARKRLERELSNWTELRHQNILPFYGVVTDLGPRLYMVSPWQENGNLLVYVKKNPQPNKNHLLCGTAAGLSYLHSQGVIHGSVKCKNVLVSHEGEPLICDFGIAKIVEEINETTISKTVSPGDVIRFSAPELIEDNNVSATMHSDTYSFAMLVLECVTEEVPFYNLSRDAAVIHARISKRQFPPRPDGQDRRNRVSDGLWDLMMRCWSVKPDHRPTMEQVHSFFLHQA